VARHHPVARDQCQSSLGPQQDRKGQRRRQHFPYWGVSTNYQDKIVRCRGTAVGDIGHASTIAYLTASALKRNLGGPLGFQRAPELH
jgi:hypothetical protein